MPIPNLAKKLLPAKKAWKSFKFTFQSKLRKLKNTKKAIIKRTRKYYIKALNKIKFLIPTKLHSLIIRRRSPTRSRHRFHYYRQPYRSTTIGTSSSAICVDELFPSGLALISRMNNNCETVALVSTSTLGDEKAKIIQPCTYYTGEQNHKISVRPSEVKILERRRTTSSKTDHQVQVNGNCKISVANSLPRFRGVDERAEEFISKFRLEMKLEREQSIIDFQEMLARSV